MFRAKNIYVIGLSVLALLSVTNVYAVSHPESGTGVVVPQPVVESAPVVPSSSATSPDTMTIKDVMTQKRPAQKPKRQIDVACMQNAVEKRDSAVIAGLDKYVLGLKAELEKRKTALKTAWAITDHKARREALREVWKSFKEAKKTIMVATKKDHKMAWKQFETDSKVCHGSAAELQKIDPITLKVDL